MIFRTFLRQNLLVMASKRMSSDYKAFQKLYEKSKSLVVLTGAGISAESGVPTFRGAGGIWRRFNATDLATPDAFKSNPSLVWEFYHYRRELVFSKEPNKGHFAVAKAQAEFEKQGKSFSIVTQNIDELHKRAGAKNLIEMHGTLFKTRCASCGDVRENYDSPICQALYGRGAPDPKVDSTPILTSDLPHCKKEGCGGLLRPHVVWFGEALDTDVLREIDRKLEECDLFLLVGTSSMVYPAAGFAQVVADRGVPVAEFNLEKTSGTHMYNFYFEGQSGDTLPIALNLI